MTSRLNSFARSPHVPAAARAIKKWAREALPVSHETAISINELACMQPGCPPRQTVILILQSGEPALKISIHKAIVDVSEQDVRQACRDQTPRVATKPLRKRA